MSSSECNYREQPFQNLPPISLSLSTGFAMVSPKGGGSDLWAEIALQQDEELPKTQVAVVYERRRRAVADAKPKDAQIYQPSREGRVSFAPTKRTSWNHSLSTRGRESIIVAAGMDFKRPVKQRGAPKRGKQGSRAKKDGQDHPDITKQKNYFLEVDAFELVEESPSPKNSGNSSMGSADESFEHDLPAILKWWRRKLNIKETPLVPSMCSSWSVSKNITERTPAMNLTSKLQLSFASNKQSITAQPAGRSLRKDLVDDSVITSFNLLRIEEEEVTNRIGEGVEASQEGHASMKLEKTTQIDLSLSEVTSFSDEYLKAFDQLLMVCQQSFPITLGEAFSKYCELGSIVKIGEGTYGEAFRAGETVYKVVPIDGDLLVNGEVQKKSEEVLEEVMLSLTLNNIRGGQEATDMKIACTGFIETKEFFVCQGAYDANLIRAWEDWDAKRGSENDHPKDFEVNQCYMVFVLADGGKDLESVVLLNYDEARSLLVQVTVALAVGECSCEFEHRDLHWGNILLDRNEVTTTDFILQGKKREVKTFGLLVSIIDFTLSRIDTGKAILFLDLSADPGLFEGPKGDKQFETYRKMREITEDHWEGSFPKTNVLWLIYLVDILLTKKSFQQTAKDERNLRSFKKRLNSYGSATDSLSDPFFSDLLIDH